MEPFSLPQNDKALAASVQATIKDLEFDTATLERRLENINVLKERVKDEAWCVNPLHYPIYTQDKTLTR
jgi:hypothetical protein